MRNRRSKLGLKKRARPKGLSWRLLRVKSIADSLGPNDLSLDAVCERARLSKCYVSHKFVHLVGCDFNEYKVMRVIEEGKRLLLTTDLTVGEISDMLGCCRQDFFSRNFKTVTGYSPEKYRNYHAQHGRPPPNRMSAMKVSKKHREC